MESYTEINEDGSFSVRVQLTPDEVSRLDGRSLWGIFGPDYPISTSGRHKTGTIKYSDTGAHPARIRPGPPSTIRGAIIKNGTQQYGASLFLRPWKPPGDLWWRSFHYGARPDAIEDDIARIGDAELLADWRQISG